jgi:hypothetical protein
MSVNKLLQRMQEAAEKAAGNFVDNVKEKMTVPDSVREERWNICSTCDKLYKPTNSCKLCGCFMKVKTTLPFAECPIKKWGTYETNKDETKA